MRRFRRCKKSKTTLQILTKDSVTVFVNAIMYYKVANPIHAVANVDDYSGSARLLAATTLRNVLGTMTLGDILCQRESIAREMKVNCLYVTCVSQSIPRVCWMKELSHGE